MSEHESGKDRYDVIAYPGHPFPQTDPDRLAVLAALHGLAAPPCPTSRVLELGCGDGENLIPLADRWPEASFVGIDLNAAAIERASGIAGRLSLSNIRFEALDVMRIGPDFGTFDYIIAHGLYSWVPDFVRDKILALVKAHLSPNGVAYISYNTFPGHAFNEMSRQMMAFHAGAIEDPARRIEEGRSLMRFLADATPANEVYGLVLRSENERIQRKRDQVLFHDDLEPCSQPFWFHRFMADAGRYGLQYLSEASFSATSLLDLPEATREALSAIPATQTVMREQYLDFVKGRTFRMTLLCHDDVALTREVGPNAVRGFFIASPLTPEGDAAAEAAAHEVVVFKGLRDETLSVDHPLTKAALLALAEIYPEAIDFSALVARAGAALGGEVAEEDVEAMAGALFRAYAAGLIELKLYPPGLTTRVSDRPEASRLARLQLAERPIVTSLTHNNVELTDETVRRFVGLVDGTRTREQLAADLREVLVQEGADAATLDQLGPEAIERNLAILAKLGLMAR